MQNLHTSNAASAASMFVVEKTDDLISALKLVRSTFAAGNVAANAPAAIDREPTSDEQAAPGLLELIRAYKEGSAAFAAGTPEQTESDEFVRSTYGDHYGALKSWVGPAVTRAEAMAALRLADGELENDDDELALAMVRAARAYFEQEPRVQVVDRPHVWALGDAASQIGSMIILMENTLSLLSEKLTGSPEIHFVSTLADGLKMMQRNSDYLEEQLHEIACRFNESANGAASRGV